jgi:Ca2+-transporting ATPase
MNLAAVFSAALIFAVIYIPFFNPIFNTVPLGWQQWEVLLPLLLIPSLAAEAVKLVNQRLQKKS